MKPINSTTTLSSFLPFLLLMHLCIMHNELYSPRKVALPGRIPSLFAKMINLAPQTEHSPYSVGFIAPVCLSKQAVWCLSSEWSKRQTASLPCSSGPITFLQREAPIEIRQLVRFALCHALNSGFNCERNDRNKIQLLLLFSLTECDSHLFIYDVILLFVESPGWGWQRRGGGD